MIPALEKSDLMLWAFALVIFIPVAASMAVNYITDRQLKQIKKVVDEHESLAMYRLRKHGYQARTYCSRHINKRSKFEKLVRINDKNCCICATIPKSK